MLAQADGTIYAGNMRYRAAEQLHMETIAAIIEEVADQLAWERAPRDNAQWGDWAEDDLAKLLAGLRDDGSDLDLLGFDDREMQALLNKLEPEGGSPTRTTCRRCRRLRSRSPATSGSSATIEPSAETRRTHYSAT